jgi:hypothetical protein
MSGDYHIAHHTQAENDARVKILEEKAIEQRTDSESDACECSNCAPLPADIPMTADTAGVSWVRYAWWANR